MHGSDRMCNLILSRGRCIPRMTNKFLYMKDKFADRDKKYRDKN